MAISVGLMAKARSVTGVEGWPFRAVAEAMEVIPRTLVQNSGGNVIRVLTELRVCYFYFSTRPFFVELLKLTFFAGETRKWRGVVGRERRDGQDCGYEDVWVV